mmetsp:Transcript_3370/g.8968  ORF Transcript_3370/g.8968 Transcript_3370/m.8968 type:complete len:350 (+) Transcript_3370:1177-2226(+)|eukprot:CAMPEP_0197181624 /NCGR_PEP_ID=MMETSP1423-20130617/5851_1 /TAXON_ID=476441 /ORGANISM="Pseudo-nitzschia heimii, Strain UNC1101" /LENGTH=349 /DNA_ID=CAMNT_0042631911 /DNA_START=1171 /DNA_END=2220 /DNA_ORIENTATION=-
MISNVFFLYSWFVLLSGAIDAFRPPENPTGTEVVKTRWTLKKVSDGITNAKDFKSITSETIEKVGKSMAAETVARNGVVRKRWKIGIDKVAKDDEDEYWYNPTIHNFGNIGFFGAIHAALAPISTKVIDVIAYDGENVRSIVAQKLSKVVMMQKTNPRVLDMCCGVGISTRALQDAFPHSELVVGVDTSSEMISMAGLMTNRLDFIRQILKFFHNSTKNEQSKLSVTQRRQKFPKRAKFMTGNAEQTNFPSKSFDLVTVMYAFHEAPMAGRNRILQEAYRVLQPGGTLAIIDISTDYVPSKSMLAGEPYVLEYQRNIHRQMRSIRGFTNFRYRNIVENHVGMWTLKRTN